MKDLRCRSSSTDHFFLSRVDNVEISSGTNDEDFEEFQLGLCDGEITENVVSCVFAEVDRMTCENGIVPLSFNPPEANVLLSNAY